MAERIHGPYQHRSKWRVIGIQSDGTRVRKVFDSLEEATAFATTARTALGHRTVGVAVNAYLEALAARGRRESTCTTARYRLLAFLRLTEGDRLLGSLHNGVASSLYARRVTEVRPDTHRGELVLASAWAAWCVKQGWLSDNPFEGVEPVGQKAAGKEQLRLDEARAFLATCLAEGTPSATAAALALLTGARASEITDRLVRDVDGGGTLLWITSAKTKAGLRQLAIPELLRERVLSVAAGKAPGDRLWGEVTRHWLGHHVRRLCGRAGVPEVSPHGLRGVAATLMVLAGVETGRVAALLGQEGPEVTRRHYLAPGAESGVRQQRLAEALTSARP